MHQRQIEKVLQYEDDRHISEFYSVPSSVPFLGIKYNMKSDADIGKLSY